MAKETGGPAFPTKEKIYEGGGETSEIIYYGMTMRDWYKGQALIGLLVCDSNRNVSTPGKYSEMAGCIADAMIKEGKE